jgi:adenylyltransferase/sulfurtransferase
MAQERDTHLSTDLSRYSRQVLFEKVGPDGQHRLLQSRVVVIGCGALGNALAGTLARAGVGYLRICDRDFVERDNLQRQVLFDEEDVRQNLPKAEAAFRKLSRINSEITIEPVVSDINYTNIDQICESADLILDGTDNFETRYLINDFAVKNNRTWIYGGVIGAAGLCMTIIPGETPCLRCIFDEPPPPEATPTCDTAGVLATAVQVVAGLQATEALKLLMGRTQELNRRLVQIDVWAPRLSCIAAADSRPSPDCPCCGRRQFPYLEGIVGSDTATLCGRNAVQVRRTGGSPIDLIVLAEKLKAVASQPLHVNAYLLRASLAECELTVFPDGRAIVKGTSDTQRARALYSKFIGA